MNAKVKTKQLLAALSALSAMPSGSEIDATLLTVHFDEFDGVSVERTTSDMTSRIEVGGSCDESAKVIVSLRTFRDSIASTDCPEVSLATSGEDLVLSVAKLKSRMPRVPDADAPVAKWPNENSNADVEITADSEWISDSIRAVLHASADEKARPNVTGLIFTTVVGKPSMLCTDGRVILSRYLKGKCKGLEDDGIRIPDRCADSISKILSLCGGECSITKTGGTVEVRAGTVRAVTQCLDGTPPSVDAFAQLPTLATVEMNSDEFCEACRSVSPASIDAAGVRKVGLVVDADGQGRVTSLEGKAHSQYELSEMKITPKSAVKNFEPIKFNPVLMMQAINSVPKSKKSKEGEPDFSISINDGKGSISSVSIKHADGFAVVALLH